MELVTARLRIILASHGANDVCLRLEGQLDGASALPLARILLDAQRAGIVLVLDLSRLSFLNVAGLRVLTGAARRAATAGGELILRHPSTDVRRLFRVTGLGAWTRLDEDGCVSASLPPLSRTVLGRFGRPALI